MPVDLNALTPSQIALLAVLATILVPIVGAVTAFVVARVNFRAAATLARESARRDHRLSTITPYLDYIDKRIAMYRELMDAGPRLSAKQRKAGKLLRSLQPEKGEKELEAQLQKGKKELDDIVRLLNDLSERLIRPTAFYSVGWLAFVGSDQKVEDRVLDSLEKDRAFTESFAVGGLTANPEKLKHYSELASEALDSAVSSRLAIEDFVFGSRGWIRRASYYLWSKLKGSWKRITSKATWWTPWR